MYFVNHLMGKLSLVKSFWLNGILLYLCLNQFHSMTISQSITVNPVNNARLFLISFALIVIVYFGWQAIGIWRSANAYMNASINIIWAKLAKLIVVIWAFKLVFYIYSIAPNLEYHWDMALKRVTYPFELRIVNNGQLIYLNGGLGVDVSSAVAELIEQNPDVTGVILDSFGGLVYEGRQLANIIKERSLNTYSMEYCYSACTLAYIAGQERYLGQGASLGFHKYSSAITSKYRVSASSFTVSQFADQGYFLNQGVHEQFVELMYKADPSQLWRPSNHQLITFRVVHHIVPGSEIVPTTYTISAKELLNRLFSTELNELIYTHEPELHQQMILNAKASMEEGKSEAELIAALDVDIETLVHKRLAETSNHLSVKFLEDQTNLLQKLYDEEPFICVQLLFPEKYAKNQRALFSRNDWREHYVANLTNLFSGFSVIKPVNVNPITAKVEYDEILKNLGTVAKYLDDHVHKKVGDYSLGCNARILFNREIIKLDSERAGNLVRYLSEELNVLPI